MTTVRQTSRIRLQTAARMLALTMVVALTACTSDRSRAVPTTTSSTSTTSTSTTSTTSTTDPEVTTTVDPSSVTPATDLVLDGAVVLVANASDVDGAAATLSDDLRTVGFTVAAPTNAFGVDSNLATSKIYVASGGEDVARSVSKMMGGVPLFEMPVPAWIQGGTAALGDATVLVMLGQDLAGLHLGAMAEALRTSTSSTTSTTER